MEKNKILTSVRANFLKLYQKDPLLILSPGRVNLIGEHTDYNQGFVLPAAVNKYIAIGLAKNDSDKSHLYARDFGQNFEFSVIDNKFSKSEMGWPNYILGVVEQLKNHGYEIGGFDCVFGGNIPIGAGMSSSAALEGGIIYGLAEIFDLEISPLEMVQFGQKAENQFVGVQCGIMDQFINIFGKENQALKLDCRSLEYNYVPFDNEDFHLVLCDSKVKHELSSSEYNIRRQQCEQGVKVLQKFNPGIKSLRDVTAGFLQTHEDDLDPLIFKRCNYVVEENDRVNLACDALKKNDFKTFGALMFKSHNGLQHDYEVSCEELDVLVEQAKTIDGLYGARMMGGGFGGCTINLVEKDKVHVFAEQIAEKYNRVTGKDIAVYNTQIESGVSVIYENEIS